MKNLTVPSDVPGSIIDGIAFIKMILDLPASSLNQPAAGNLALVLISLPHPLAENSVLAADSMNGKFGTAIVINGDFSPPPLVNFRFEIFNAVS